MFLGHPRSDALTIYDDVNLTTFRVDAPAAQVGPTPEDERDDGLHPDRHCRLCPGKLFFCADHIAWLAMSAHVVQ